MQHVYLLNKYLKCSVRRLALRYDIYIYIQVSQEECEILRESVP